MYFVEEMRDEINRDEECGDRLFNDWEIGKSTEEMEV